MSIVFERMRANENKLSLPKLKDILYYNPITGLFRWEIRPSAKVFAGDIAGSVGYSRGGGLTTNIKYLGINYKAHRLAWFYMTGEWPEFLIKHIDGDTQNNKWGNLASATQSKIQNTRKTNKNSKTGISGVRWVRQHGKWRATIGKHETFCALGSYDNLFDACCARKSKENSIKKEWDSLPNYIL